MAEKKPAKRAVSRPRLMKALLETMEEHGLREEDHKDLIAAITADIVKQAMS